MSTGRFERSSGDVATGTCGTDRQEVPVTILFSSLLCSSSFPCLSFNCVCRFLFGVRIPAVILVRLQQTSEHCYSVTGDGYDSIVLGVGQKKRFHIKRWQQAIWQWDKAFGFFFRESHNWIPAWYQYR